MSLPVLDSWAGAGAGYRDRAGLRQDAGCDAKGCPQRRIRGKAMFSQHLDRWLFRKGPTDPHSLGCMTVMGPIVTVLRTACLPCVQPAQGSEPQDNLAFHESISRVYGCASDVEAVQVHLILKDLDMRPWGSPIFLMYLLGQDSMLPLGNLACQSLRIHWKFVVYLCPISWARQPPPWPSLGQLWACRAVLQLWDSLGPYQVVPALEVVDSEPPASSLSVKLLERQQ